MTAFEFSTIAQISAARIVDCLFDGVVIAVFAALISRTARKYGSSVRFTLWFAALVAIAMAPVIRGRWWAPSTLAVNSSHAVINLPPSMAAYLFGAWAAIAGIGLLRIVIGLWNLHRIRMECVPLETTSLDARLRATLENYGSRGVSLCLSEKIQVPTALGLLRPSVSIPRWTMQELSVEELNQVLLHELAHLRRRDDWTNLAQKLIKALLFFHPAVWWIDKRLALEREVACDDSVIAQTESPRAYAECLAHLAERSMIQRGLALAQAALGRVRQMSERVAQILDGRDRSAGHNWKPAIAAAAAIAIVSVVGISNAPQLISFSGTQHDASAVPVPASESVPRVAVPVIQASLRQRELEQVKLRPQHLALAARFSSKRTNANIVLAQQKAAPPRPADLTREVNFRPATIVATEAVLVVMQDPSVVSNVPVYQVQIWHVVVWRPVADPVENKVPKKI